MSLQRTLSIVKPDAVMKGVVGSIFYKIESSGLAIIACKSLTLSRSDAVNFYIEHKERPFFDSLVDYISSGRVFLQVLEGVDAIAKHRQIIGHTDPKKAEANTIRFEYGESIERNAVHGSDSEASAEREIRFFFSDREIT